MKIKIHFHVLLNINTLYILQFFIVFCFDACLTLLLYIKNIFPYIIIESKMQQVSLQKKKKNQYIDFFTFRIYIIYYYIIILFWDEFEIISYKSQLLLSFFALKKKWCQIFMRNCMTLQLVTDINWDKSKMMPGIIWVTYLNRRTN